MIAYRLFISTESSKLTLKKILSSKLLIILPYLLNNFFFKNLQKNINFFTESTHFSLYANIHVHLFLSKDLTRLNQE